MKHKDYCGCCGNEIPYGEWCLKCSRHLVPERRGLAPWDRTYFAQFAKACPYEETEDQSPETKQTL